MSAGQPLDGHVVKRFDGDLEHLHMLTLEMGGLVLHQARQALEAFRNKDLRLAQEVTERDQEVDRLQMTADAETIELIARRGPVARDLRAVIAMSRAVSDLERTGDEAVRIAQMTLGIFGSDHNGPSGNLLHDVQSTGRVALAMLEEAVDVLDRLDEDRAVALLQGQSELEVEFQSGFRRLATYIMEDHRNVGHAVNMVLVMKALERVGDHACNIAEHVIFLVEGKDLRHLPEGGDLGTA